MTVDRQVAQPTSLDQQTWHMLVVSVHEADVDHASDVLWRAGVVAIEERVAETSSESDSASRVELWTSVGEEVEGVVIQLRREAVACTTRIEQVPREVADTWRTHAQCAEVTETLVICPSWKIDPHPPAVKVVRIDPHDLFGLGNHPTTRLTLQLALRICEPGSTVVDVGCGSGVLGIALCVARHVTCFAYDIHPSTRPVVESNAALNDCVVTVVADASTLPDGVADLVLANILAPVLIEIAPDIVRMSGDDTIIILSGLRADQREQVLSAYQGWSVIEEAEEEGWLALGLSQTR